MLKVRTPHVGGFDRIRTRRFGGFVGFIEIFCAYSMDKFCNVHSNDCWEIGLRANGRVCVIGSDPLEFAHK